MSGWDPEVRTSSVENDLKLLWRRANVDHTVILGVHVVRQRLVVTVAKFAFPKNCVTKTPLN